MFKSFIMECGCDSNIPLQQRFINWTDIKKGKKRMYYLNILYWIPIVGTYHVIMVSSQIDHLMINYQQFPGWIFK